MVSRQQLIEDIKREAAKLRLAIGRIEEPSRRDEAIREYSKLIYSLIDSLDAEKEEA